MKKIISMMLIAALSVVSLTGCGQAKAEEEKQESTTQQDKNRPLVLPLSCVNIWLNLI